MLLVLSSGEEQEAEGDAVVAADAEFPMITVAPGPGPGHWPCHGMDVPRRALGTRGKLNPPGNSS